MFTLMCTIENTQKPRRCVSFENRYNFFLYLYVFLTNPFVLNALSTGVKKLLRSWTFFIKFALIAPISVGRWTVHVILALITRNVKQRTLKTIIDKRLLVTVHKETKWGKKKYRLRIIVEITNEHIWSRFVIMAIEIV